MNIKISDLLFEDNNIHEYFEKGTLTEDKDKTLNNTQLDLISKRISSILDKAFPSGEEVYQMQADGELDDKASLVTTSGMKTIEKKQLMGMVANTFSVKGEPDAAVTQIDISIYERLGFIPLLLATKDGEDIEGRNSQGKELVQLFLLPLPGFRTQDQKLIGIHKELFKLDGEFNPGDVLFHVGVGSTLRHISIPVSDDAEEKSKELEKIQQILRAGNGAKILELARKNNGAQYKSVKTDSGEEESNDEPSEDVESSSADQEANSSEETQDTEEITSSVSEGRYYKDKLANLLFEKKSLNSKNKKHLVESYLSVDYNSLNNFQKRDALQVTKFLVSIEKSLIKESEEDVVDNAVQDFDSKSEKEKGSILKSLSKFKDKIKNSSLLKKINNFISIETPKLNDKIPDAMSSGASEKEEKEEIASDFSDTYVIRNDKEGKKEEEDQEKPDQEDSEELTSQDDDLAQKDIKGTFTSKIISSLSSDIQQCLKSPGQFYNTVLKSFNEIDSMKKEIEKISPKSIHEEGIKSGKFEAVPDEQKAEIEDIVKGQQKGFEEFITDANNKRNYVVNSLKALKEHINKDKAIFKNKDVYINAPEKHKEDVLEFMYVQALERLIVLVNSAVADYRITVLMYTAMQGDLSVGKDITQFAAVESGDETNVAAARIQATFSKLGVTPEEALSLTGSKKSNESYLNNLNLLNPDVPANKVLMEAGVKDKSLLRLNGEIVRGKDGKIIPSSLRSYYKSLENNSAFKDVKERFIADFESSHNKKLHKSGQSEIADHIHKYFVSLAAGGSVSRTKLLTINNVKKLGKGTASIAWTLLKGAGLAFILGAPLYIGWKTYSVASSAVASATTFEYFKEAMSQIMTGITDYMTEMLQALNDSNTMGEFLKQAFELTFGEMPTLEGIGEFMSAGWNNYAVPTWEWLKAPFVVGLGDFASHSPYLAWIVLKTGAIFNSALASGADFFFKIFWNLEFKSAAANLQILESIWESKAAAMTASAGTIFAGGFVAPGVISVLILAGICYLGYRYFDKKKQAAYKEKLGEAFKLYLLSAATGEEIETLVRLLNIQVAESNVEMFRELSTSADEITNIFTELRKTKDFKKDEDISINSANDLEKYTKEFKVFIASLRKSKKPEGIKSTTLRVLDEAVKSFEDDIALVRANTYTDDDLANHYNSNNFLSIVRSKLMALRPPAEHFACTISDVTGYERIDSKEMLIEVLQERRDQELQSLKKFGDFKIDNDPIGKLVAELANSGKDKLDMTIDVSNVLKMFKDGDKIKESDIDFDSILNALSSTHANITASDTKRYLTTGLFDSKKIKGEYTDKFFKTNKGNAEEYVKKFGEIILPNVLSGLERLVDTSFIADNFIRRNQTSQLLNEYKSGLIQSAYLGSSNPNLLNANLLKEGTLNETSLRRIAGLTFAAGAITRLTATGLNLGYKFGAWSAIGIGQAGGIIDKILDFTQMVEPVTSSLLAMSSTVMIVTAVSAIWKNKMYKYNFNPYKDKDFIKAVKPFILQAIRIRVGASFCSVLMRYKSELEKLGIKVTGEDSPEFAAQKKSIEDRAQSRKLKKNMNDFGSEIHKSIREIVYNVKNKDSRRGKLNGLGLYLSDPLLEDFVDSICFKTEAPLAEVFKSLQSQTEESKAGLETSGFVYQQGLGLLLNEAPANKEMVNIDTNKLYSRFMDESHKMLYNNMDYNGTVNDKIVELVEPYFKIFHGKGVGDKISRKAKSMWRNFSFFKWKQDTSYDHMIEIISAAMSEVTAIPKNQIVKIIFNDETREKEQRERKLQGLDETLIHKSDLAELLFEDYTPAIEHKVFRRKKHKVNENLVHSLGLGFLLNEDLQKFEVYGTAKQDATSFDIHNDTVFKEFTRTISSEKPESFDSDKMSRFVSRCASGDADTREQFYELQDKHPTFFKMYKDYLVHSQNNEVTQYMVNPETPVGLQDKILLADYDYTNNNDAVPEFLNASGEFDAEDISLLPVDHMTPYESYQNVLYKSQFVLAKQQGFDLTDKKDLSKFASWWEDNNVGEKVLEGEYDNVSDMFIDRINTSLPSDSNFYDMIEMQGAENSLYTKIIDGQGLIESDIENGDLELEGDVILPPKEMISQFVADVSDGKIDPNNIQEKLLELYPSELHTHIKEFGFFDKDTLFDMYDENKVTNPLANVEYSGGGSTEADGGMSTEASAEESAEAISSEVEKVTGSSVKVSSEEAESIMSSETEAEKVEKIQSLGGDEVEISEEDASAIMSSVEKATTSGEELMSLPQDGGDVDPSELMSVPSEPLDAQGVKNLVANGLMPNGTGKDFIIGAFEKGDIKTVIYQSNGSRGFTEMSFDSKGKVMSFRGISGEEGAEHLDKVLKGATALDTNSEDVQESIMAAKYIATSTPGSTGIKVQLLEPKASVPVAAKEIDFENMPNGEFKDLPQDSASTKTITFDQSPDDIEKAAETKQALANLVADPWSPKPIGGNSAGVKSSAALEKVQGFRPKFFSNEDLHQYARISCEPKNIDFKATSTEEGGMCIEQDYDKVVGGVTAPKVPVPPVPEGPPSPGTEKIVQNARVEQPGSFLGADNSFNIKTLGSNMAQGAMMTRLFRGFITSEVEPRTVVPLIRGIDWARLIKTQISGGVISYLVRNRDKLKENGVKLVGELPAEVREMERQTSEDFGEDPAMKGAISILSKSAAKRLKNEKGGEVTEKDVEKYLASDVRKLIFSYHKAFSTETFERIRTNKDSNLIVNKTKEARGTVNRKTAVGLLGIIGGGLTATGVGAALGLPLMALGGVCYSNRTATYNEDMMISGDENEIELNRQIEKLTKEDVKALIEVIIDISKESKGIQESRVKIEKLLYESSLASLLFESDFDMRPVDSVELGVDKVINALSAKSLLCYNGDLTPGSDEFKAAESYVVTIVCRAIQNLCGIKIKGLENYNKPQNIQRAARAQVAADVPVNKPAIENVSNMVQGCGAPGMQQPMNSSQFMNTMNNSGGPMMQMFYGMMMYNMMKQGGGNMQEFQSFMKGLDSGKVTTEQAAEKFGEVVDSAPKEVRTVQSSDGKQTVVTKDKFVEAFKKAANLQAQNRPSITPRGLKILHKRLKETLNATFIVKNEMKKIYRLNDSISASTILNSDVKFAEWAGANYFNLTENAGKAKNKGMKLAVQNIVFGTRSSLLVLNEKSVEKEFNFFERIKKAPDLKQEIPNNSGVRWSQVQSLFNKHFKDITAVYCNTLASSIYSSQSKVFKAPQIGVGTAFGSKQALMTQLSNTERDTLNNISKAVEQSSKIENFNKIKLERLDRSKDMIVENVDKNYLLGSLSSLLFEERVVERSSNKRDVKSKVLEEVDLRNEWLKLWDI